MKSILSTLLACLLIACATTRPTAPPAPMSFDDTDASPALDKPLTATRAMQAALATHAEVRAELARLDVIAAEQVQAGLLRNPMLSLMALRPEGGGFALEASWMQSLFDLLTRSRRIDLADAVARRERAEVAMRLLDLGIAAQSAFHDAVASAARERLLQSELALDVQALDLQSRWTQRGLSPQSELLRLQAQRDERRHMLHEAEIEAARARSLLAERIGLATHRSLRLPDAIALPALPDAALADWQARARSTRPELRASAAAIDIAARERELEGGRLRTLEPDLGLQFERDGEGMVMAGPELRIAVPWFDRGQARAQRLDAGRREAAWRDEAQRRRVLIEVERALDTLAHAAHARDDAERHLAQTQIADALSARQYRSGNIDLMARIDAQRAVLAAERQQLDARLALAQAHIELQRAVGGSGG